MSVQFSPPLVALNAAIEQVLAADPREAADAARLAETELLLVLRNRLDAAITIRLQVIDTADTTVAEEGKATRPTLRREPDRSFAFTGPAGQQRRRPRDP